MKLHAFVILMESTPKKPTMSSRGTSRQTEIFDAQAEQDKWFHTTPKEDEAIKFISTGVMQYSARIVAIYRVNMAGMSEVVGPVICNGQLRLMTQAETLPSAKLDPTDPTDAATWGDAK